VRWYVKPFDGIFTQQYLYQKLRESDNYCLNYRWWLSDIFLRHSVDRLHSAPATSAVQVCYRQIKDHLVSIGYFMTTYQMAIDTQAYYRANF